MKILPHKIKKIKDFFIDLDKDLWKCFVLNDDDLQTSFLFFSGKV